MSQAWRIYSLVILLAAFVLPSESWGHRDRGPGDPCRREVGASLLHITFYQTQFDPVTEYCEEIPRVGNAFLVVDVTPDLWERPIGVELLASDSTGLTSSILSLPLEVYERGVANVDINLQAGIRYEVRVVLGIEEGAQPREFSFPFQVSAWYKAMVMPALIVLGLIILIVISAIRYKMTSQGEEALAE